LIIGTVKIIIAPIIKYLHNDHIMHARVHGILSLLCLTNSALDVHSDGTSCSTHYGNIVQATC